jgi:hypothetical protein
MLKGLAEAAEMVKRSQRHRDGIAGQGARAYMMGIEVRDNPLGGQTERKIWEEGWTQKQYWFAGLLQRWRTL